MAKEQKSNNGANLGFEAKLFLTADKLRGSMDASEYKHVALGLVFLKYISDAFSTVFDKLQADEYADEEDAEEYLAERTFWVPKEARWGHLQANAKQPTIGKLVDDAMLAIEKSNASLKGVLPTNYAREALNKTMLGRKVSDCLLYMRWKVVLSSVLSLCLLAVILLNPSSSWRTINFSLALT